MSSDPSTSKNEEPAQLQASVTHALKLFNLTPPLTQELLKQQYQDLLLTWHPHRYANLTNNPTKYMQMYKKGEAMTKEIHAAYNVLNDWLKQDHTPSEGTPTS